jgi:hypothetical protein
MRKRAFGFLLILLFASALLSPVAAAQTGSNQVKITDPPREGFKVRKGMTVKGTASIPSGHYLWVLTHRIDFEDFWWPQGEGKIDPKTGEWKVGVTFGGSQDVGWDFEIAVIVVNKEEHTKLSDYRRERMKTNDWTPEEMPSTAAGFPPVIMKVNKESHN